MLELNIDLDPSGGYLYDQIYRYIKGEIQSGGIRQGEKLPSTRALAEYLHISRSTADLAYSQLMSEGYIHSRRGSGYYASAVEGLYDLGIENGSNGSTSETTGEVQSEPDIIAKENSITGKDGDLIDFSPGKIEMKLFPFDAWKKISKNIMADDRMDLFSLGNPIGDEKLRSSIAHYLHAARGVNCSPEQIIVGAGNDYLLMLLRMILGENKKIGMENPTYLRACRIFMAQGYEVLPVESDESGMCADRLEELGCDLAYVMPAHQFPTGIVMPIARRLALLSWAAAKKERYLIEDDYDSEFRYRGRPIPSLQASDQREKVIYIGTFSKSIAPAIRVSYMILPRKLMEKYRENCSFFSSTVSRIDQGILNEFMQSGRYERYLNRMRNLYKSRHDILLRELKCLQDRFEISGEGAGLHVILTEKRKFTESDAKCEQSEAALPEKREQELKKLALREGVLVYPETEYLMRTEGEFLKNRKAPRLLLGYGALEKEQIIKGIQILDRCWK